MNNMIKKFLLARDKYMSAMRFKQPEFTYSACEPKSKARIQKFKATRESRYIYRNKLDKACFQHDMTYRYFKDLPRRTTPDKVLRDKAFEIASNSK